MDKLIYLAGPITGCTFDGCTEWRDLVRNTVPKHIKTLSPMRGKAHLKAKSTGEVIKDHYKGDHMASVKGINTRDYFDVSRCDLVFVNFIGAKKVSIGTVMEIAWARAFSKPVICCMEHDNIHHHSMLDYACGYIVETLEEGLDILTNVLSDDQELKYMDDCAEEFNRKFSSHSSPNGEWVNKESVNINLNERFGSAVIKKAWNP